MSSSQSEGVGTASDWLLDIREKVQRGSKYRKPRRVKNIMQSRTLVCWTIGSDGNSSFAVDIGV
jgi:hypothetical protein